MAASPSLAGEKRTGTGSFLRAYERVIAHGRAIILVLILAYAAFLVVRPDEFGPSIDLVFLAILVVFIASQLFWIGRVLDLGERFIPGKPRRAWLAVIASLVYLFFFIYSFPSIESTNAHIFRAAYYRLPNIVTEAVFWWWFVGSMLAFALIIAFATVDRAARAAAWMCRKARDRMKAGDAAVASAVGGPSSPARRRLLEQTALLVSATPFVAAGYGLLYGRLEVEITRPRIRLARLPKAFEGFRIAQLSDIHISPFTTADHIRHCVTVTNGLKPDLVALTGDYIAWDPETEADVVRALAGLRAPHGVFGCLGNHEHEGEIEESITRLFTAQGIHILRQNRASLQLGGETLNLIGMDEPRGPTEAERKRDLHRKLRQIKELAMPDTANILLTHFPEVFDYVTGLGVDLTLTGHTHGGQLSLDFVHRGLSLGRLETPYVSGWYEHQGAQLYVNRGIGTTGFPIRLGARPEITVLELTRRA